MADIEFTKERGKDRKPNLELNLEEFISVKGITALGNQLTKDKINQISLLESLPYEAPEEVHADEIEVVDEEQVKTNSGASTSSESEVKVDLDPKIKSDNLDKSPGNNEDDLDIDDTGQVTLF